MQKDEILFSVNTGRRAVKALGRFLLREELFLNATLEPGSTAWLIRADELSVWLWASSSAHHPETQPRFGAD